MKLLYLSGLSYDADKAVVQQLERVVKHAQVKTVVSQAETVVELNRAASNGGVDCVVISPTYGEDATLQLIAWIRNDGPPVPIVPVLTQKNGSIASAAIQAAADAVLQQWDDGVLVNAARTLKSVTSRRSQHATAPEPPAPAKGRADADSTREKTETRGDNRADKQAADKQTAEKQMAQKQTAEKPPAEKPGHSETHARSDRRSEPPHDGHPERAVHQADKADRSKTEPVAEAPADPDAQTPGGSRFVGLGLRRLQGIINDATRTLADPDDAEFDLETEPEPTPPDVKTRMESMLKNAIAHRERLEAMDPVEARLSADDTIVRRSELTKALEAHEADKASWDTTRQALEARIEELHLAAEGKDEIESSLKSARRELERVNARLSLERSGWEANQAELKTQIRDLEAAVASKKELEKELDAARRKTEEAAKAQASADSGFEAERRKLQGAIEARITELRAAAATKKELEEALSAARSQAQRATTAHAADAKTWTAARQKFEAELARRGKELTAAVGSRAELQTTVEGLRADLKQAVQAHTSSREAWDALRQQLEGRVRELEAGEHTQRRLDETLREERARHDQVMATNRRLEIEASDARHRAERLHEEMQGLRTRLDAAMEQSGRSPDERLRQARRAEEVSRLAVAMAPDLEMLVAAIGEHGTRLLHELTHSDPHRQSASSILATTDRINTILRQFQAFSRKQARPVASVDLNEVISRAEPVLARLSGEAVDFRVHLGQTGPVAAADDDCEQLVTSLVFSARELLTAGGSLVIETMTVDGERPTGGRGSSADASDRTRVRLAVTASGYGIQPAQALPALEVIVRRCNAELVLGGDRDRTAIFQVFFPLAAGEPAQSAAQPAPGPRLARIGPAGDRAIG